MNKYEVWATVWSDEHKKQIKVVVGEFDKLMNAVIFQNAYNEHYCTKTELVEYVRK